MPAGRGRGFLMSVLHLSTATSGLPGASKSVWIPRMAAALCDDAGNVTDSFAANIRADGRHIETAASRIHGITTAQASRTGIDEIAALMMVCGLRASGKRTQDRPGFASCARTLVAWDAAFVCGVINSLFAKHGEPSNAWLRPGLSVVSLQDVATPFCKLAPEADDEASGAYCKPSRDEAAAILIGASHSARPLPHVADTNLALERALYAALKAQRAFETVGEAA